MPPTTALAEARVARFVQDRLTPHIHRRRIPLAIEAWDVPGEPVPFAEAVRQDYRPFAVGTPWSRAWGTTWFHVTGTVPEDGAAEGTVLEVLVDLGFIDRQPGFQAEGLVHRPDGSVVKAIEPCNGYVPLAAIGAGTAPGTPIDLWIEAASNPDVGGDSFYGETPLGDLATAGDDPIYTLRTMDLAWRDETVWELNRDVWTLQGLMGQLDPASSRRAEILAALERACDAVDPDDVAGTAADGRRALEAVLAAPAH
ncbi:alpha-mannosidase, partial [Clavibacter michiganensis]